MTLDQATDLITTLHSIADGIQAIVVVFIMIALFRGVK